MKSILALILFLHSTTSAAAATFFVKPTNFEDSSCFDEPCCTLDQYARNSSAYFTTGSTFVFLPGNHSLQSTVSLFQVSNITFTKWGNDSSHVYIFCKSEVAIFGDTTGHFTIQGLTFFLILDNSIQNSSFVTLIDSRDIVITNSTFQGSGHLTESFTFCQALVLVRTNIDIKDCLFIGNTGYNGGAVLANETAIKLTRNIFMGNKVLEDGGAVYASGGSLNINQENSFSWSSAKTGGAIFCTNNCILNVTSNEMLNETGIVFVANNANLGAAIYLDNSALSLSGRSRIEFRGNVATNFGAGIMLSYSTMISYAENLYFISNVVDNAGGVICASYKSSVVLGKENKSNSYFLNNSAGFAGGAISVWQELTLGEGMHYFINNTARYGGAVYFGFGAYFMKGHNSIIILKGNSTFKNNHAKEAGGAIMILFSLFFLNGTMLVSNNEGRYGGGMHMRDSIVIFNGSATFQENLAVIRSDANHLTFTETTGGTQGGSIYSKNSSLLFVGPSFFYGNEASRGGAIYSFSTTIKFGTVYLFSHNRAELYGGAIYADQTAISILLGGIKFAFNSAQNGGAMYFYSSVTITAASHTGLFSSNNSATHYGGSIYYNDSSATSIQCMFPANGSQEQIDQLPLCFLQFEDHGNDKFFYSNGDYAGKDGSFLYGGLLDRCKIKKLNENSLVYEFIVPFDFLSQAFSYLSVQDNKTRNVTSKPYQLCFCTDDQTYNCLEQKTIQVYRGQTFNFSVLALDQMKNIIPTLVTAQVGETATLGFNQSLQTSTEHCTNLTYSFYSMKNESMFILHTNGPCHDTGLAHALINVEVLPCPHGFNQSREKCICDERLQRYRATCSIEETVYFSRETGSGFWMGALYSTDGHYEGLILYKTCPFDYCKQDSINLTLQSLDKQCNVNRGKVLCGACVNNSSLMLGGYQCGVCSNRYLTLIVVFAVAGIVLVIFLSFLRLTVAMGMINGVILYANIVQVNRIIFFPDYPHNVLTVFIAWLNLDLGFRTCFYAGMDAYALTWLQFVFPLYVWILIALIIFFSRYSITVSKLIGSNPVAVLATLLLMSYTKILNILIEVYSYVELDYPGNSTARVWLKDANVPYLKSWHLLLTLVSTLILVLLFIPYTFFLLIGYKLYCYSGKKCFHWLIKVKPLLDSYYAPYKIHTRFWTGLLLLVRCCLYVVFSFNSLGGTTKSLLVIIITFLVVIFALLSIRIYSSFFLNIFEALIYLNLVVLSASSLAGFNSPPLVHTMVGAVFVTMTCVLVYHLHLAHVKETTLSLKVKAKIVELMIKRNSIKQEDVPLEVSKTVVDLREPLLDND